MVIRRASDSTTTTIGFDTEGNIDETAIETFCTGTTCTVSEWKDQSGNGNDATQSTASKQPIIYTGGALVKEKGRLALRMASNTINLSVPSSKATFKFLHDGSNSSTSWVVSPTDARETSGTTQHELLETGEFSSSVGVEINYSSSQYSSTELARFLVKNGTGTPVDYTTPAGTFAVGQNLATFYIDADNATAADRLKVGLNGGTLLTGNTQTAAPSTADSQLDFTIYGGFTAHWQEAIVWNADKSSVRTSIEENIGDYFTQNTPLLDTYSGAAAAYSLRRLSSSYTGDAVEVYNGSSYADIGFNVFGELDTVALAAHCGSSDGFVSKWYDQSGNTNTAAQSTTSQMPKLYDGTTGVLTENGKPTLLSTIGGQYLVKQNFSQTTIEAFLTTKVSSAFIYSAGICGSNAEYAIIAQENSTSTTINQSSGTVSYRLNSASWSPSNRGDVYTELEDNQRLVGISFDANSWSDLYLGYTGNSVLNMFSFQEVILYSSDQSSNRTNIETNVNTFYNIY
jgi:hypothetical protein